jgi:hypothetical protein
MKLMLICLSICFLLVSCNQNVETNAQEVQKDVQEVQKVEENMVDSYPDVVGGYTAQNVNDPEMVEVANKTIELLKKETPDIELVKILSAATQVVAGLNYRLVLKVKTNNQEETWTVVVYRGFDNSYQITDCKK